MERLYQSLKIALAQADKQQIFFSSFFLSNFLSFQIPCVSSVFLFISCWSLERQRPRSLPGYFQIKLFLSCWCLGSYATLKFCGSGWFLIWTPLACTTSCTSQNAPQRHKAVSAVAAHTDKIQLSLRERNLELWSELPINTRSQSTGQLGLAWNGGTEYLLF